MVILIGIVIYVLYLKNAYDRSNYKEVSNLRFRDVYFNLSSSTRKGYLGEYRIYKSLMHLEGYKRIFANVYLPKEDGSTTEIDLILIHEKGIVVVESKNYSGWIYGKEEQYQWTQVLNKYTKNRFYNPILQNKSHIKYLDQQLKDYFKHEYFSLIVFGKGCKLKSISINSRDTYVLKEDAIEKYLKNKFRDAYIILTEEEIDLLAEKVEVFSKVDDSVKAAHIRDIKGQKSESFETSMSYEKKSFFRIIMNRLKNPIFKRLISLVTIIVVFFLISVYGKISAFFTGSDAPVNNYKESNNVQFTANEILKKQENETSDISLVNSNEKNVSTEGKIPETNQESINNSVFSESLDEVSQKNFLHIGMDYESVVALYGEPHEILSNGTLKYQSSTIELQDNQVVGWQNYYDQLSNGCLLPEGTECFLGSSKSEVLKALGTPTLINSVYPDVWHYDSSVLNFENDLLIGYDNLYDQISYGLVKGKTHFNLELGMDKNDVISILGAPSKVWYVTPYEWHYQNSKIWFDTEYHVIGWHNAYNQMDQVMSKPSSQDKLKLGLSQEKALEILGTPTTISYINPKEWQYANSSVWFDDNHLVIGWSNSFNQLDYALFKAQNTGFLELGLSDNEVLEIMGSPTKISQIQPYEWHYNNSRVWFDQSFIVIGYEDWNDQLQSYLKLGEGGQFNVGSTKEEVFKILGAPKKISWIDSNTWYYNNASLYFVNNLVQSVYDPLKTLEPFLK